MDRPDARTANPDHAGPDAPVNFGDGYPILITSTASLRALNRDIVTTGDAEAVPMNRFRPNLVIDEAEPFAEDGWNSLKIGDVILDLVKPSDRCIVTTIDQLAGETAGSEPLDTLRRTRLSAVRTIPGVLFGWNAVPRKGHFGRVAVGDGVEILERRDGFDGGALLRKPRSAGRPASSAGSDPLKNGVSAAVPARDRRP